jgi:hypothetical protein
VTDRKTKRRIDLQRHEGGGSDRHRPAYADPPREILLLREDRETIVDAIPVGRQADVVVLASRRTTWAIARASICRDARKDLSRAILGIGKLVVVVDHSAVLCSPWTSKCCDGDLSLSRWS